MSVLHMPWLHFAIIIPLVGALRVRKLRDPDAARRRSLVVMGLALACCAAAFVDFNLLGVSAAQDRWDPLGRLAAEPVLVLDGISAPLLPLAALLHFLTALLTMRTKVREFSFSGALISEAILLATLCCREPWSLTAMLVLGTLPGWLELRARRKPTRVYRLHMGLFVVCLIAAWLLHWFGAGSALSSNMATGLLVLAVLVRSGIVPFHAWVPDLFEHATFGTALLTVAPMPGAYAAVRLVLPGAPEAALQGVALLSLATALYTAGMALVQREARRFFCYLFLSNSALVLVGLETATAVSLTGALSLWLSIGVTLGGFGLVLRCIEARTGRMSLASYHGLYAHTPPLGPFFLLAGLASVGFPGTFGFAGMELLLEAEVAAFPLAGVTVVVVAALNGIAVIHAYFRVFTGARHGTSISLSSRSRERIALFTLAVLILGGGLFPQPGIRSRDEAALELMRTRQVATGVSRAHPEPVVQDHLSREAFRHVAGRSE